MARECIMSGEVDVIVNVADASCLERSLYLTLQLIELGKPVVLALNMMDIVEERGMEIDLHRLPEMLGVPAIPVSARKKTGLSILMHAVAHHTEYQEPGSPSSIITRTNILPIRIIITKNMPWSMKTTLRIRSTSSCICWKISIPAWKTSAGTPSNYWRATKTFPRPILWNCPESLTAVMRKTLSIRNTTLSKK